jgi:hypothetical protein
MRARVARLLRNVADRLDPLRDFTIDRRLEHELAASILGSVQTAYQQQLEARRGIGPRDDHDLREHVDQDLAKARVEMERAWLAHIPTQAPS